MARPRANWKGVLKIGELVVGVALYTAASTSERVAFHTLNRKTGHRVHRQFVDSETGKPVEREDQVKGYETPQGEVVMLEPEEIAEAVPESDKTLSIEGFVPLEAIDTVYFDRPYYLAPSDDASAEAFGLLCDGMRGAKVAALAQTVLFRRLRSVLIRPQDKGMIATTLNFDYEVRSEEEAFADIPRLKLDKEMLDLAGHIIGTKSGRFDPSGFDDRYEAALAELVKAKIEGRRIKPRPHRREAKVVSLLEALRESAKVGRESKPARKRA
ncbi:non-homologous end joining protein Ku [Labrys miyagiensis]